jgi:hypothetical protein
MLVSSDFLGYLNRKKEVEKKSGPLIQAAIKTTPGGDDKNPSVAPVSAPPEHQKGQQEVEYLNEKSSTVSVIL